MEFIKKMNTEVVHKKLSDLEEGKEYKILDYNFKFVESLKKYILNVTVIVDGVVCSVRLPDKIRRFVALSSSEQDEIIGRKFKYNIKYFKKHDGEEITNYNVRFKEYH
jgi:hypothetical protein